MSVAWQADIFCDGRTLLNMTTDGCEWFIEQGEVQHDDKSGLAAGAWIVAKANGWTRIRDTNGGPMMHLCPKCAAERSKGVAND